MLKKYRIDPINKVDLFYYIELELKKLAGGYVLVITFMRLFMIWRLI